MCCQIVNYTADLTVVAHYELHQYYSSGSRLMLSFHVLTQLRRHGGWQKYLKVGRRDVGWGIEVAEENDAMERASRRTKFRAVDVH